MNLQSLANRHFSKDASRKMVAFIHGRHCSRFPLTASLGDAIDITWRYGTDTIDIAADFKRVASYADLDQYTRGHQPYRKV